MSDASTTQSVECPICGDEFDPTVAGGWCTNTECGEWQYTEAGEKEASDAEGDDFVSPSEMVESNDDGFVPAEAVDEADADADDAGAESDPLSAGADPLVDETDEADADDAGVEIEAEAVTDEVADDADLAEPAVDDDAEEAVEDSADEVDTADDAEPAVDDDDDAAEVTEETDEVAADDEAAEVPAEADGTTDADEAEDAAADSLGCPDCGTELEADANFCLECGADVSDVSPDEPLTVCPGCDADVEPDANFCPTCGEDLDAHRDEAASDDALDALESEDEPVPESLVLAVEGREIPVEDGEKVGREIRAALMDAGRSEDEAVRVHREHVRFVRESDSFYLLDLAVNPTRLNDQPLSKGDREPVGPGDDLELSGVADIEIRAP